MISILHGDHIAASRQRLSEIKKDYSEIISLEGKSLEMTSLIQSLQSNSLFGMEKLVVIENLSQMNLRTKQGMTIVDYLANLKDSASFVIWDQKILSAGVLGKFKKKAKIELFKYPAVIFAFVDSLYPSNTAMSLKLLKDALKTNEPEVIFAMIVRQFRLLIAVRHNARIEEVKRLMSWQIAKLKKQAEKFTEDQLLQFYKELLIIDYQIKTGRSAQNLTKRIELFIMNL